MDERKPGSWDALVKTLFKGSYNEALGRYRSPFAFRGMCGLFDLRPSLHRLDHQPDKLPLIEKAMFRNFQKYAYHEVPPTTSEWKWLSLAQHHGLPTRLLDWTYSPFVALHFATNELDKMDRDGVIWMVSFVECHKLLPTHLQEILQRDFAQGFSVEMLEEDFKKISDVEKLKGNLDEFVVFFEPPSLDPRIVNQFGLFSFMNRPLARLDHWLENLSKWHPRIAQRVVISAGLKWEVRDKLDQMNITERVLMPGLDGLSTWLKRWYTPKAGNVKPATTGPPGAARPRRGRPRPGLKKRGST